MNISNQLRECYELTIGLTVEERESNLQEYLSEAQSKGLQYGIMDTLYRAMRKSNFCFYPASTKYHSHHIGGLYDHCKCVTEVLRYLTKDTEFAWSRPCSPFIIGFLHDIDKTQKYLYDGNNFVYNKAYSPANSNHGLNCAFEANKILNLTEEEFYCIRFHMGAFEDGDKEAYSNAIEKYPNVLLVHTADMIASQILEVKIHG